MLLLRWSPDATRKLYARLGERVQASLLNTRRGVRLPAGHSAGAHSPRDRNGGGRASYLGQGQPRAGISGSSIVAYRKAHAASGALSAATDLPCTIDDNDDVRRVRESMDTLRKSAQRADRAQSLGEASGESASD